MKRMQAIAHVDVNSFYASAERAFDPSLEGKPLIVFCVRLDSVLSAQPSPLVPNLSATSVHNPDRTLNGLRRRQIMDLTAMTGVRPYER